MSGWRDRASMQRTASQFPRTDDATIWSDLEACDAEALMAAEARFAEAEREAAEQWHRADDGRLNPHSSEDAYTQGTALEDWEGWDREWQDGAEDEADDEREVTD